MKGPWRNREPLIACGIEEDASARRHAEFSSLAGAVAGGNGGLPGTVGPSASFREASLRGTLVTCLRLLAVLSGRYPGTGETLFIAVSNLLFCTEQAPEGGLATGELFRQSKSSDQVIGRAESARTVTRISPHSGHALHNTSRSSDLPSGEPTWARRPYSIFSFLHDPQ